MSDADQPPVRTDPPTTHDATAGPRATLDAVAAANRAHAAQVAEMDADRCARWQPSTDQLRWAKALFAGDFGLDRVFVALVHPGKTSGWWTLDTKVEPVPGLWPVPSRPHREADTAYRVARDQACEAARRWLGEREGTVSYVVIDRDGHAPAFED